MRFFYLQEEVSFQDVQRGEVEKSAGAEKLEQCCIQAIQDGLSYVRIDTCCIDKDSSTELSEAINSMSKWYKNAALECLGFQRQAKLYAQFIDTTIKEKEIKLKPILKRLEELDMQITSLQQERQSLQREKEGEYLCLSSLQSRPTDLKGLPEALQSEATMHFDNFGEYYQEMIEPGHELGLEAACEEMLDDLDLTDQKREKYAAMSEPGDKAFLITALRDDGSRFHYFATNNHSIDVTTLNNPEDLTLLVAAAHIGQVSKCGQSALSAASQVGDLDIVRLLLDHGAETELSFHPTQDKELGANWTPLAQAATMGYTSIVRVLLEHGARTEPTATRAIVPLVVAAESGYLAIVAQLLDFGANIDSPNKALGRTALMVSATVGNDAIVRLLLQRGANKWVTDSSGRSARDITRHRTTAKILDDWDAKDSKPSRMSKMRASLGKWVVPSDD
ncbi:ankyrin repeat-containing domain protein [Xylariaceae sp. FL0255]|nr:ankyrin repeat-containing domain protein [Xylariaceae sp. FL0255]